MILAYLLSIILGLQPVAAQQQHKPKVPGLDKVTAGPSRQAFTGTVQSLDLEHRVLNVNTVQGSNTEIFPFNKGTRLTAADGTKLKPVALKPGTIVMVYYEQKGDRRMAKQIEVLSPGAPEGKKAPLPSQK